MLVPISGIKIAILYFSIISSFVKHLIGVYNLKIITVFWKASAKKKKKKIMSMLHFK